MLAKVYVSVRLAALLLTRCWCGLLCGRLGHTQADEHGVSLQAVGMSTSSYREVGDEW